ncbi:large exoprotein [Microbacterium sp. GXF7504]
MYYDDGSGAAFLAFLLILIPILLITALISYVISAFLLMRIFDKAGVQGKWRAWVPVYNWLVFSKLGDFSPWVALGVVLGAAVLSQVPVIGWLLVLVEYAMYIVIAWRVGQKLDKEWYFLLLWLIPGLGALIWLAILAFDSSRWNSAIRPAPWASTFLADKTVWQGIPQQASAAPAAGAPGAYPPPAPGAYPPPAAGTAPGAYPPPPAAPAGGAATGDVPPAPPAPPSDPEAPRP